MISVLIHGDISLNINGTDESCQLADPFIIPPYSTHRIAADFPYDMVTLCVNKYFIDTPEFKSNASEFLEKAVAQNCITPEISSILLRCIHSLHQQRTPVEETSPTIAKVLPLLETYPENKISIDEMAQAANLSKYYFIRTFKNTVGLTPHQFQLQNKIRKAQQKLNQGHSLTTVALDAGFYEQSHFIREFHKSVNLTPKAYSQQCKKLDH